MHARRVLFVLALCAFGLSTCRPILGLGGTHPTPTPQIVRTFPDGCPDFGFDIRRCTAIVRIARSELSIDDPAAQIELLSEPPSECGGASPNGAVILCARSGGHVAVIVRITVPGARPRDATFWCGVGSQYSIACTDTPTIQITTPMDSYRDTPCSGQDASGNPTGCATPLPSIQPGAAAAGWPLVVAVLDVPVQRDGLQEVRVGTAGIPNGVLTSTRARLAQTTLPGVVLDESGISLQVRSTAPGGRPFQNIFEHGWRPGVETADVFLVFTVVRHDPGAVIPIRELEVR